jgi:hypothetical protein
MAKKSGLPGDSDPTAPAIDPVFPHPDRPDNDLADMNLARAKQEILKLRAAIRLHRDVQPPRKADVFDQELYENLPEGVKKS